MTVSVPAPPDILSPEHAQDPYETYRILLEHYPVLFHAPTNSWLVSRHEDVFHLFKTKDVSSENYAWQLEPVHGRTIIQMEGKEHTKHRSLLNPYFHGLGSRRLRRRSRHRRTTSEIRSSNGKAQPSGTETRSAARSTSCPSSRTSSRSP